LAEAPGGLSMFNVFDSVALENNEDFILIYSKDDIYSFNLILLQAYHAKITSFKRNEEILDIVSFKPQEAILSNNKCITLKPVEISKVSPIIMEILLQYPKLKSKAERQEELIMDLEQRLGIPDAPGLTKKRPSGPRDLINPRLKKPTKSTKPKGFVDEDDVDS
jgi:hypothetical protein